MRDIPEIISRFAEGWVRSRELWAMSREAKREIRRSLRKRRKLRRSIARQEARIPFYLEMISAVDAQEEASATRTKQRLEGELDRLLMRLETERQLLRDITDASYNETYEKKLRLLRGILAPKSFHLSVAVAACLVLSVLLCAGLVVKNAGRDADPPRTMLQAKGAPQEASITPTQPDPMCCETPRPTPDQPAPAPPGPDQPKTQEAVSQGEPAVRWHAVDSLCKEDVGIVERQLIEFASDPDPRIRGRAAAKLAESSSREAREILEILVHDEEPYVRSIAKHALDQAMTAPP